MMGLTSAFSSLGINEPSKECQNSFTAQYQNSTSLPNLASTERSSASPSFMQAKKNGYKYNKVVKIYNNSFSMYAETDLDQPTNYSLRYAEGDDTDSDDCNSLPKNETSEFVADTIKTYYTEDTPYETPFNFSTSTSMSDLRQLDDKASADKLPCDNKNAIDPKPIANVENLSLRKPEYNNSGLMSPEKPVNYCEEGTPAYPLSRVDSYGSLNMIAVTDPVKSEEPKEESPEKEADKKRTETKVVKFEEIVNYAEETPLMFSRSSSLASLESIEHQFCDDRSSVVSDISRMTSGLVSPSELPDSPTQTVPPSPKSRKSRLQFPTNSKPKLGAQSTEKSSVFEDNITKYKVESTPIEYSRATSLSSLLIDDNDETKHKETDDVETTEEGPPSAGEDKAAEDESLEVLDESNELFEEDEDEDEDILAACINSGMKSNRYSEQKATTPPVSGDSPLASYHYQGESPEPPLRHSATQNLDQSLQITLDMTDKTLPLSNNQTQKSDVTGDCLKTYCTEDTPAILSHAGSNSDLSILSMSMRGGENPAPQDDLYDLSSLLSDDDEDNVEDRNLLQSCIKSGMTNIEKLGKEEGPGHFDNKPHGHSVNDSFPSQDPNLSNLSDNDMIRRSNFVEGASCSGLSQNATYTNNCKLMELLPQSSSHGETRCSERKKIIDGIRKQGNFLHNKNQKDSSCMITCRRLKADKINHSEFGVCGGCKGYFSLTSLRKHVRRCESKHDRRKTVLVTSKKLHPHVHSAACDILKNEVLPVLRRDQISSFACNDRFLVIYGNKMCAKYRQIHHYAMIRNKLRTLSSLFINMKDLHSNLNTFEDIFDAQYYDSIIKVVNIMARLDEKTGKYGAPSTAFNLGILLKYCVKLYISECIKFNEQNKKCRAEDLLKLMTEDITTAVNKTVNENQYELKRKKNIVLPKNSDIQLLNSFLTEKRRSCYDQLKNNSFDVSKWKGLACYTLISIQVFNRRRAGEIERMLIENLKNYQTIDKNSDPDIVKSLSQESQDVASQYARVVIRGKLNRDVPVLMHTELLTYLQYIVEHRVDARVPVNNPYVFGIPGATIKYLRACPLLREYSVLCGAAQPSTMRGTELRKHIATQSALLDLRESEVEDLANFMGHETNIHKQYYRLPIVTRELTHMSQLLEKAQGVTKECGSNLEDSIEGPNVSSSGYEDANGRVDSYKEDSVVNRRSFKECYVSLEQYGGNIQDTVVRDRPSSVKRRLFPETDSDYIQGSESVSESPSESPIKNHGRSNRRGTWTTPEKKRARELLEKYPNKLPSMKECRHYVRHFQELKRRTAEQLKVWVKNQQVKKLNTTKGFQVSQDSLQKDNNEPCRSRRSSVSSTSSIFSLSSDGSYENAQALLQQCIRAGMSKHAESTQPQPPQDLEEEACGVAEPQLTDAELALLQQCILEGMRKNSANAAQNFPDNSSVYSDSADLTEADQDLLRQCIRSGMPKNRSKSGIPRSAKEELSDMDKILLRQCILEGMPKVKQTGPYGIVNGASSSRKFGKRLEKESDRGQQAAPGHSCCVHCPRNQQKLQQQQQIGRQSNPSKMRRKNKTHDRGQVPGRDKNDFNLFYMASQILSLKKEFIDRTHVWV